MNAKWHSHHPMPANATIEDRLGWHLDHAEHCACRPVPPRLLALKKTPIRDLLSGGDRRSSAQSATVLQIVRDKPKRVAELVDLADDADWLVSMRAMDLLEKLAHQHPDWIAPYKLLFIGNLADSDKWEIQLQIVRVLPLFTWRTKERRRVADILIRDLEHPQKFVKAWALDSLATLASEDAALMPIVSRYLDEFDRSGSKALAARSRHIRKRLDAGQ